MRMWLSLAEDDLSVSQEVLGLVLGVDTTPNHEIRAWGG